MNKITINRNDFEKIINYLQYALEDRGTAMAAHNNDQKQYNKIKREVQNIEKMKNKMNSKLSEKTGNVVVNLNDYLETLPTMNYLELREKIISGEIKASTKDYIAICDNCSKEVEVYYEWCVPEKCEQCGCVNFSIERKI